MRWLLGQRKLRTWALHKQIGFVCFGNGKSVLNVSHIAFRLLIWKWRRSDIWKLKTHCDVGSKSLNLFPIDVYYNNGRLVWVLFCLDTRYDSILLRQHRQLNDKIHFQKPNNTRVCVVCELLVPDCPLRWHFSFFDGRTGQWTTNNIDDW